MYNQQNSNRIVIEDRPSIKIVNNNNLNSSNLRDSVTIRRPEATNFNYQFLNSDKLRENFTGLNNFLSARTSTFSLSSIQVETCKFHQKLKDYILLQPVGDLEKYTVLCNVCYEELRRQNKGAHFGESYIAIIYNSGDEIAQIRNNEVSFGTYTNAFTSSKFINASIFPLAQEMIMMIESFESDVVSRICGVNFSEEDLYLLKNWMNSIELDASNNPKTEGIGRNPELMNNYVKLAVFLSTFQGLGTEVVNKYGVTQNLRNHILRMIQLRKLVKNFKIFYFRN